MPARPPTEADRLVKVHLSDVPLKKRLQVADRVIRVESLSGTEAIRLKMAATNPRQDPAIRVPRSEYLRVLG